MSNIYYDKRKYKNIHIRKLIDEFIINFNTKQFKIIDENENEYEIFKYCNSFFCKSCNDITYKDEYCVEHYDKYDKNNNIDNYINKCRDEIKNNELDINKIFRKYHKSSLTMMFKIYKIIKYFYDKIFPQFNQNPYYRNVEKDAENNILQKQYINYNEIAFKFDENMKGKYCEYKTDKINYKNKNKNKVNVIVLLILIEKKISRKMQITNMFIKKLKKGDDIPRYMVASNSITLMQQIINSSIINYIEFINTEYILHVLEYESKKCRDYRVDIFMILKIDNIYHKIIIETDEKHHSKLNNIEFNKSDFCKDKYAIETKTSIFRLNIDERVNDETIKLTLFLINQIFETKGPIYYFNENYIKLRNKIERENKLHNICENICLTDKKLEKGTISIGGNIIGIYK
jgi:hypothetical protein